MRRRTSFIGRSRAGGAWRAAGPLWLALASGGWACGGLSQNDLGSGGGGAPSSAGGAAGGSEAVGGATAGGGVSPGGGAPSGSGGIVASGGADSGGTTSSSGGSATASGPECEVNEDCEIAQDCCSCHAVPKGAVIAVCQIACAGSNACEAQGIHAVPTCSWGKCTATNCDPLLVACDSLPPECPSGQTASVTEDACWGPCVAIAECVSAPDCDACGDGHCVQTVGLGLPYHCVAPQAGCEVGNLCECLDDPCGGLGCVEEEDGVSCFCAGC